ncbi:hypothetical protein SK128_022188, partial [Halocaridina rubra]
MVANPATGRWFRTRRALPSPLREPSAYSVLVAGWDEGTLAMVSRNRCFCRHSRSLLQ